MAFGIIRVAGEAIDADQIGEWKCDECGLGEYSCDCGPDVSCDQCGRVEEYCERGFTGHPFSYCKQRLSAN